MAGVYVPLTREGNILVDGVLASCYASIDHDMAHITMTHIRWFPAIIQWIFGEDNGILTYAKTTEELAKWILPHGQI